MSAARASGEAASPGRQSARPKRAQASRGPDAQGLGGRRVDQQDQAGDGRDAERRRRAGDQHAAVCTSVQATGSAMIWVIIAGPRLQRRRSQQPAGRGQRQRGRAPARRRDPGRLGLAGCRPGPTQQYDRAQPSSTTARRRPARPAVRSRPRPSVAAVLAAGPGPAGAGRTRRRDRRSLRSASPVRDSGSRRGDSELSLGSVPPTGVGLVAVTGYRRGTVGTLLRMRALLVVNPAATTTSARTRDVLIHALASEMKLEVVDHRVPGARPRPRPAGRGGRRHRTGRRPRRRRHGQRGRQRPAAPRPRPGRGCPASPSSPAAPPMSSPAPWGCPTTPWRRPAPCWTRCGRHASAPSASGSRRAPRAPRTRRCPPAGSPSARGSASTRA